MLTVIIKAIYWRTICIRHIRLVAIANAIIATGRRSGGSCLQRMQAVLNRLVLDTDVDHEEDDGDDDSNSRDNVRRSSQLACARRVCNRLVIRVIFTRVKHYTCSTVSTLYSWTPMLRIKYTEASISAFGQNGRNVRWPSQCTTVLLSK